MRKALVVGINHYEHVNSLHGCAHDAEKVADALERHSDGSVNFSVKVNIATDASNSVSRADLKAQIKDLFAGDGEIALFYFAGHGHIESTGGYLIASDAKTGDEGLPLGEVLKLANDSAAKNRIIILDSCHSGLAGSSQISDAFSELKEGTTILTASTAQQYASERDGSGVFTSLFVDALWEAGNLVGDVTPGAIYAHVDQSLGPWEQRPVFKTNVKNFVSVRKVNPPIALEDLRKITELFPAPGFEFQLDPSFEPEMKGRELSHPAPNPQNTERFSVLQKYNRVNLLVPVGAPHMWHAAMESRFCKLTVLGEHYRRLVELKRL